MTRQRLWEGLINIKAPGAGSEITIPSSLEAQADQVVDLQTRVEAVLKKGPGKVQTFDTPLAGNSWWGTVADIALYAHMRRQPVVYLLADGSAPTYGVCDATGQRSEFSHVQGLLEWMAKRDRARDVAPLYIVNQNGNHFTWAIRAALTDEVTAVRELDSKVRKST